MSPGRRPMPIRGATVTSRPRTTKTTPQRMRMRPMSRMANRLAVSESNLSEMEMTDLAAVSRARGGDADAFRTLVERHSRAIFRVAYRMTGNEHDADDVVQEAFLRAYRQIEKFEERANFGTWLHRIAVNCSLDLLRSRGRHEKNRITDKENEDGEMTRELESTD